MSIWTCRIAVPHLLVVVSAAGQLAEQGMRGGFLVWALVRRRARIPIPQYLRARVPGLVCSIGWGCFGLGAAPVTPNNFLSNINVVFVESDLRTQFAIYRCVVRRAGASRGGRPASPSQKRMIGDWLSGCLWRARRSLDCLCANFTTSEQVDQNHSRSVWHPRAAPAAGADGVNPAKAGQVRPG